MMLGACPGHTPKNPMAFGVQVSTTQHGCRGPGSQGERGELLHKVVSGGFIRQQVSDGRFLNVFSVFAGHHHCVVDLAGVNQCCSQIHTVDEAKTGVCDIKVCVCRDRKSTRLNSSHVASS